MIRLNDETMNDILTRDDEYANIAFIHVSINASLYENLHNIENSDNIENLYFELVDYFYKNQTIEF